MSILVRSSARPSLYAALDSVAAQTWRHIEIVVVAASGMTHPSLPARWQDRPLRLLTSSSALPRAVAANVLLDNAHGKYLNFLDDDDTLLPQHVATLAGLLQADQAQRLAYSVCEVRDANGVAVGHLGQPSHHLLLRHQSRFAIHAALFDRMLVERGARFDESLDRLEDLDFFIACATRTGFAFEPTVTCVWNAFTGASGMGYGANAHAHARSQLLQRIQRKWSPQFDEWARDPAGLLCLAERAAANRQWQTSAQLFRQVADTTWPDDALRERARVLSNRLDNYGEGPAAVVVPHGESRQPVHVERGT